MKYLFLILLFGACPSQVCGQAFGDGSRVIVVHDRHIVEPRLSFTTPDLMKGDLLIAHFRMLIGFGLDKDQEPDKKKPLYLERCVLVETLMTEDASPETGIELPVFEIPKGAYADEYKVEWTFKIVDREAFEEALVQNRLTKSTKPVRSLIDTDKIHEPVSNYERELVKPIVTMLKTPKGVRWVGGPGGHPK